MIEIKEPIEIACKNCRTINIVTPSDLDAPEIDSEERSMGSEKEYLWESEFNCKKCNNEIRLIIRAFEYPIGFLNYSDSECFGGLVQSEPQVVISHDEND